MTRNLALVVALGFCWGLNWPAVRLCLDELSPWTLRAAGFAGATALIFALIAALRLSARIPRAQWWRIAVLGILATVAYNMLTAYAQLGATTARSAVLSYTMPVWAVIFARFVLGEPFDARRRLGLGLGVAGLAALGFPLLRAGELSWSLAAAIGSGISWAASSVFLKRFPVDAPPLAVAAWQLALGFVTTSGGMLLFEGLPARLPERPVTWAAFAYHVVFAQVAALTLWFTILSRMPAGIASIASLLVPGIGVVSAAAILGERPTGADWLGLVLIVAASASVLLRPSGAPAAAAAR